jgi:regulatory protein YycI of two-component signal transduction system YycFG
MKKETKNNTRAMLIIVILLAFIGIFIFLGYSNLVLQRQIDERDEMIRNLAFNDTLVHKYFDISEDSVKGMKYYTLKQQYQGREINHYQDVSTYYKITEQDSSLLNQNQGLQIQYNNLVSDYQNLIDKYNELATDFNKTNRVYHSIKDTVKMQNMALDLIRRNYDISYIGNIENDRLSVSLKFAKAAFYLLPYYRKCLRYDSKTNKWVVKM